jgi:hypothetical protein
MGGSTKPRVEGAGGMQLSRVSVNHTYMEVLW